ncbi:zinc finger, CCHC-type containing protein [Tanacetum coccineum]|uniref:Zinc finger, CCHC-type containing protein n=1 Tax=Tanacetum coccineum TaxID=301880 RepID=A0ABQ4ZTN4_9ASTR
MAAAMKHMASNFAKLEKFEGRMEVIIQLWSKSGSGPNGTMTIMSAEDTLEAKYMAKDASSKKFLVSNFTNYKMTDSRQVLEQYNKLLGILGRFTQHKINMDESIQVGSHLRIEESLKAQDNDKPKGNNVVASITTPPVTCWKCEKPGHLKRDCKAGNVGNKANGSGTKGSVDGSSNPLKGQNMFNKSIQIHYVTYVSEAYFVQDDEFAWLNIVSDNIGLAFMSTSELNDSILWHARLGHVHFKRMQDMSKDGFIPAFDKDTEKAELRVLGAVARLPDPKLKTLGERGIECIFVGYAKHSKAFRFYVIEPNDSVVVNSIIESRDAIFDENRFSLVPKPSQMSLKDGTKDSGDSVIPEKITEDVIQQPEPKLRKSKRHRTPKDFGPGFQLYLIEGTRDLISDQHSYYFNVEEDPKTFDEAMKSQDVSFWKKTINDEMDSIMGNKTWVFTDLPLANLMNLDMTEADVILGIRIKHESNEIAISQYHYIEKVLKKFNYSDCTPVSTPMVTCDKLMPNKGHVVSQLEYSRVIGCLCVLSDIR